MTHLLDDDYLKPFESAVRGRAEHAFARARHDDHSPVKNDGQTLLGISPVKGQE